MIWNPAMETLPKAELQRLQSARLTEVFRAAFARVPYLRARYESAGVTPDVVLGLRDLPRLPFLQRQDFAAAYPFGMLAVPRSDAVRVHASSGTTGKPTIVAYTRRDLDHWAELCARALAAAGARPGDVFVNAYSYGLPAGGLGLHAGADRLGLTVVPASDGNPERLATLVHDLGASVLASTPSLALAAASALAVRGVGPDALHLRCALIGAEPWSDAARRQIEAGLGAVAVNLYGLSEAMGPGVASECAEARAGAHVQEDHFVVEVIDPKSLDPLPYGATGEVVITSLTKEALPILRYRTGDIASLEPSPCACGRTHARLSRIAGRTDDMLIIGGTNVFPSQIEAAIMAQPQLTPHYQLIATRGRANDALEVRIEVDALYYGGVGGRLDPGDERVHNLMDRTNEAIRGVLGFAPRLTLVEPGGLPRSDGGRLRRVLDLRPAP